MSFTLHEEEGEVTTLRQRGVDGVDDVAPHPESGVVHAVSALCAGSAKASVRAASAPSRSAAARSAASEALTSST